MNDMFCYQCEQAAGGKGCTKIGVCGKGPEAAALQDLLAYAARGIAAFARRARELGACDAGVDRFVVEALFYTVTNVNFDEDALARQARKAADVLARAQGLYHGACRAAGRQPDNPGGPAAWTPAPDLAGLVEQGRGVGVESWKRTLPEEIVGLRELLTYGLKGTAAYADHAMILGREDDGVYAFFHEALDALNSDALTVGELLTWCLRCGEVNLKVMEMLDAANTGAYGHPQPTAVRIEPLRGKAILVSGHDLKDLEDLLKQTEGKGIRVYTHGEMLPAHGYPGLKKFAHLAGNYGGAWQDQQKEFDAFPGAILMTTNCIQKPRESYKDRLFTTGLVGWPGVAHVTGRDFSPVIRAALATPGFAADGPDRVITVGFARNAVLGVAGKVVGAVQTGAIRRFFLIGGCDGARSGRNYYTQFAEAVPKDCVILTLACGKYRFNKLDFGDIRIRREGAATDESSGIPRLLDCGQCNDAYSAIQIAVALAGAFNCGVNDLPLSLILSWYEQKAVCILLTLLHLGIRNIRLGPSLPAFVAPAVLQVLADKFNVMPITTAEKDLAAALAGN